MRISRRSTTYRRTRARRGTFASRPSTASTARRSGSRTARSSGPRAGSTRSAISGSRTTSPTPRASGYSSAYTFYLIVSDRTRHRSTYYITYLSIYRAATLLKTFFGKAIESLVYPIINDKYNSSFTFFTRNVIIYRFEVVH